MKYKIISEIGYTNWVIENFVRSCGYLELTKRRFVTYSKDRYCNYELYITINPIRIPILKHDINKILKSNYHQNCKKFWKLMRVRE